MFSHSRVEGWIPSPPHSLGLLLHHEAPETSVLEVSPEERWARGEQGRTFSFSAQGDRLPGLHGFLPRLPGLYPNWFPFHTLANPSSTLPQDWFFFFFNVNLIMPSTLTNLVIKIRHDGAFVSPAAFSPLCSSHTDSLWFLGSYASSHIPLPLQGAPSLLSCSFALSLPG